MSLTRAGGAGRETIPHARLVRAVVVEGRALSHFLAGHGVEGRRGEIRARDALFAALGRIAGAIGIEPADPAEFFFPSRPSDGSTTN